MRGEGGRVKQVVDVVEVIASKFASGVVARVVDVKLQKCVLNCVWAHACVWPLWMGSLQPSYCQSAIPSLKSWQLVGFEWVRCR